MNTRGLAIKALEKIENGSYSNLVLNNIITNLDDRRDRALLTAIVYGVLRYQGRLDYIISQIANRSLKKIDKKVLIALRVAIYQIDYFDRIPKRAAVNETIEAVKTDINRGAVGFINGVLRNYIRNKDNIKWPDKEKEQLTFISKYYSHPQWIIKKWIKKYGFKKTISLCKFNNRAPDLKIRRNRLKYSQTEFISAFKREGIKISKEEIKDSYVINNYSDIKSLPLYNEGGFFIQGNAATLTGHMLNPLPGMRILDMTAGPGGKTTHMAELMENQGEIIALDIYDHKINLIEKNCNKLGIDIVQTIKKDAQNYKTDKLFDKILVDAPCSGLGILAQKPELKWRISPSDIDGLSKLQYNLIEKALMLLKPGGELLYSTCTLTDKENIEVVKKIMNKYSNDLKILSPVNQLLRLNIKDLVPNCDRNYLELFPPMSGTEGFFMVKFRKNKGV